MMASDFKAKLHKLNSRLQISAGDDAKRPAALWMYKDGEPMDICGVDKNWIQEFPTYDQYGKMIKGGWNRILVMLVSMKLIDRTKSYKIFGRWDIHREPPYTTELKPLDRAIAQLQARSYREIDSPLDGQRITVPVYNNDDVYDIGKMVKKQGDLA
jgi:hypothetical protein